MTGAQQLVAFALIALVVANLFWGPSASSNRGAINAAFTSPPDSSTNSGVTQATMVQPAPSSPKGYA